MQNPAEQSTYTRNNIQLPVNQPTTRSQPNVILQLISEYQQVAGSLSSTILLSSMPPESNNSPRPSNGHTNERTDSDPELTSPLHSADSSLFHSKPQVTNSRSSAISRSHLSIVPSGNTTAWNEILTAVDPRTHFFCQTWIPILEKSYGFKPYAIVSKEGDTINGVLPILEVNSAFTGKRGISLPFIDFCRSYHTTKDVFLAMYDELKRFGQAQDWDYFELRGDFRHLEHLEPSLSFYNHVIDLSAGVDQAFSNLTPAAQRAVRKARKEGVQVEESREISAIDTFYKLQCITRQRHGLPPQPYSFFKNLHERIIDSGEGSIFTARLNGDPISCSIFIQQADIVHYKYGASDYRFQNTRCNNLVMWTAIETYSNRGFKEIHLGRNSLGNQGLRKYKLSWGSKEGLTRYHRYDLKKDQISSMTDDAYGWHNKFFKLLPSPLAKLAGSILYRHIA